jgi:hypothetical protein
MLLNGSRGELLPFGGVRDPSIVDVIRGLDDELIDELTSRPSFADDDVFEVVIERRVC